MKNSVLLSDNMLSDEIERLSTEASEEISIISAYISNSISWLNHLSNAIPKRKLLLRGRLSDFLTGSSNIQDIEIALDNSWEVHFLENLHAKLFTFDDQALIGSANLTSSGILLYGCGNVEAMIKIPVDSSVKEFSVSCYKRSNVISTTIFKEMCQIIEAHQNGKQKEDTQLLWPLDLFPQEQALWIADLPWLNLNHPTDGTIEAIMHDTDIFGFSKQDESINQHLLIASKIYNWISIQINSKPNKEIYFGELSARLHEALKDDPTPYRSEIKNYLQNIVSYLSKTQTDIKIDRPNYSQRFFL